MFSYTLLNHPESFVLDEEDIAHIFFAVHDQVPREQHGIINIAFLSDDEIQVLNKNYRSVDSTTDVLSFHYFDEFNEVSEKDIAGEIILSETKIISQAAEHAHSMKKETEILVLHAILHILGFDHESDEDYSAMWKYEEVLRHTLR